MLKSNLGTFPPLPHHCQKHQILHKPRKIKTFTFWENNLLPLELSDSISARSLLLNNSLSDRLLRFRNFSPLAEQAITAPVLARRPRLSWIPVTHKVQNFHFSENFAKETFFGAIRSLLKMALKIDFFFLLI